MEVGLAKRGQWGAKLEFFLASIGYAVGLGNIWRFPYLCYKNGGGAFLIPYIIMLALVGLPVFFMEFAFGQFASLGPISVWNISPLFKGIGYAMVFVSWLVTLYYNVIVAECLYYFVASFTWNLPWTSCNNSWSTSNCRVNSNETNSESPSFQYYYYEVIQKSASINEFGLPSWKLTLALLFAWILCAIILIKGVKMLGKISYFTATFPYIMLTALLVKAAMSEGSLNGIKYFLTPKWENLLKIEVWSEAATQIFYSLGCCTGSVITISSFNKFRNNCCR